MATLVIPGGSSSLDRYALRLARRLDVPVLRPEPRGVRTPPHARLSPIGEELDASLLDAMRRTRGLLHLPHHHLGRYGLFVENPFVITVHDLIRVRDLLGSEPPYIYRPGPTEASWVRLDLEGIRRAARIIVPSRHTLEELHRFVGIPRERIEIVPHGVDRSRFRPASGPPPLPGRYLLCVGSEHPRKNLRLVFEAFDRLRREARFRDVRLVKAGRPGGRERDYRAGTLALLRDLGLDKDVVLLGRIPGDLLVSLYGWAEALLFPSLSEGFGLPPLEAMACGCPVIASCATSVPEVVGEAGLLLDPTDPAPWAEAVAHLLEDRALRDRLVAEGLRRASRYSWEETARRTRAVYESSLTDAAPSRDRFSAVTG